MNFDSYKFNDDSEPRAKKKIRKNDDDDEEWINDYNYFSRAKANVKTRNKNISKKEIYLEQIENDKVFNKCIQHPRLLEYLDLKNYYDIYDYVKYCNKRGVLLDVPIKQHFGEIIEIPNYDIHQKQNVHQQNYTQRYLLELDDDLKRLKISVSQKEQKEQKENITKYYDIAAVQEELQRVLQNRKEQRRQLLQRKNLRDMDRDIRQQKQQNRRAEELKQLYEETPLDQPINEQTIKNCILDFLQFNREVVDQFQPRVVQRNNFVRDEIDYDSLSEDSLEEICAIHPKQRKNFTTLNFTRRIQIIRIVSVFSRIKDSTLE